jgi:imidazolonepropionase-like amidohydrolase
MLMALPLTVDAAEAPLSRVVVHCGTVIDPASGARPLTEQSIVIDNGRIARVDAGYIDAAGATQTVELRSSFCLPGLIDSHVHLTMNSRRGGEIDIFADGPADEALKAAHYARDTLMAGFTTVRDLGGIDLADVALKRAIQRGDVVGPRMLIATYPISITGGHNDHSGGYREDRIFSGENEGVADGVDGVVHATRLAIKRGADVIKIMATGGVLSIADSGSLPQFTLEEMKAICDTAHDHGLKVAAHAHGDEGARRAVLAGVSSIEHGTYLTPKTYELMKRNRVYLVPTVIAGMSVAENAQTPDYYPASIRAKALEIGPMIQASLGRAWRAGVPIAFGTDGGVYNHGRNGREFEYMVGAGMPAIEAIRAGTQNAADLLGRSADVGSLQPGRFGDLVAVDRNPLEDIKVLQQIPFVMKQGVVYKAGGKPQAF